MDKNEKNYGEEFLKKFKDYVDKKKNENFKDDSLDDIISSANLDDDRDER